MNNQDIKLEEIADTVCRYYKLDKKDFLGQRRFRHLAEPRQMYCYISRKRVKDASLKSIGRFIGHKDHSTVIHAVRKINNLFDFDKKIREDYKGITKILDTFEKDPVEVVLEFIRTTLPMDTDLALEIERKVMDVRKSTH
jgi:chromosomal replication initiator protein